MLTNTALLFLSVLPLRPEGNAVIVFDLHMMPSGMAIATVQSKVASPMLAHPNAVTALNHRDFFASAWLVAEPGTLASTLEVS
jgi:hypothetical protein